jgi:hypothetical protein
LKLIFLRKKFTKTNKKRDATDDDDDEFDENKRKTRAFF